MRARFWRSLMLTAGLLVAGCLPKDTRPTPGRLYVTVSAGDATLNGLSATDDGWSIVFDRFLIAVGRTELSGSGCNVYSDGSYGRISSMRVPGAQKVSITYAIGDCDFGFHVSSGRRFDPVLGEGVTQADKVFMGTLGSDRWFKDRTVGVYVEGHATKDIAVKRFAWAFRQGISYQECAALVGGTLEKGVVLRSGQDLDLDLPVHGENLFLDPVIGVGSLPGNPKYAFQRFADADDKYGNQDGEVTLEELDLVPFPVSALPGLDAGLDGGVVQSYADFVYLGLVQQLVRFGENGVCTADQSDPIDLDATP